MIIFPTGLRVSRTEHLALLHVEPDAEQWLKDTIAEKARKRRKALIDEWRPRFFADPAVTELPADADALVSLIIARPEYRTRHQKELAQGDGILAGTRSRNLGQVPAGTTYQTARFNARTVPSRGARTLFPSGIDIPDADGDCILAFVDNLEEWVHGAILGHINRGTKKMITQYEPILQADPTVATIPATKDGLIAMIAGRADYKTLPAQLIERRESLAAARATGSP